MGSVCGYLAHSLRPWNRRYGIHSNGTVKNGNQYYVCKLPIKQKKKYNLLAAKSMLQCTTFFVKLYVPVFIHNEVRDFDKNSTQPEIRVNRVRDNESQLYIDIHMRCIC
jgi:hypothetical protein